MTVLSHRAGKWPSQETLTSLLVSLHSFLPHNPIGASCNHYYLGWNPKTQK